MSKKIKWPISKKNNVDTKNILDLYKFVVAKKSTADTNMSLFCVCYLDNQIRIYNNCLECKSGRKTINGQTKYILNLDKIEYSDSLDKKIIDSLKRCQLFDLDFGPQHGKRNSYYVVFDSVDKNYQFPEKNTYIKSIRMEFISTPQIVR